MTFFGSGYPVLQSIHFICQSYQLFVQVFDNLSEVLNAHLILVILVTNMVVHGSNTFNVGEAKLTMSFLGQARCMKNVSTLSN